MSSLLARSIVERSLRPSGSYVHAVILILALSLPGIALADPVEFRLQWDASATGDVRGYWVYVGTRPGVFSEFIDVGLATNYVYAGDTRTRYFFAIRAYSADGSLSLISNLAVTSAWPTLFDPGPQSSPANSQLSLPLQASDPEELPLAFTVTGLPPGLVASTSGVITGAPTTMGSFTIDVVVRDQAGNQDRTTFSWSITPPLPATPIPLLPAPLSLVPTRTPVYAWTLSAGADGYFVLSIDSLGVVRESVYGPTSCYVTYCAVHGDTIAAGAAIWAVAAYNVSGESPASVPVPFAVIRPPDGRRVNAASAIHRSVAAVSSQYDTRHGADGVIDGDRRGVNWGANGGWRSEPTDTGTSPEWIEVQFASAALIDEIDVFGLSDEFTVPTQPAESDSSSSFTLLDFQLQYDYDGEWRPIPGAFAVENAQVWRRFTFGAIFTTRIRLLVTRTADDSTRVVELEAWGALSAPPNTAPSVSITSPTSGQVFPASSVISVTATASDGDGTIARVDLLVDGVATASTTTSPYSFQLPPLSSGEHMVAAIAHDDLGGSTASPAVRFEVGPRVNYALASYGTVAVASSTLNSGFPAAGAIDGDRRALNWGIGGGWNDATANVNNDWLEVRFSGARTIDEVSVIGLQDNWSAGLEPTPSMTGSFFGVRDFRIEYLSGSSWRTVTNGNIVGNNLIWRRINFSPVTTTRIRIVVTRPVSAYARIVEFEARGPQ